MIRDGIIITFPVKFLLDLYYSLPAGNPESKRIHDIIRMKHPVSMNDITLIGFKECIRQIEAIRNSPDDNIWNHSIGTKPTMDVQYAYITILGKIRYRANIAAWEPGGTKMFIDGRKRTAKHWLILSDLMKAPKDIECKGFQGFRYTDKLF